MLRASGLFPFYQPVTFRSAARRIGIEGAPPLIESVSQRGHLAYPKRPIDVTALAGPPPNILWLAVESMRWDLLTPTTMPRLWAFAADNLRFTHHYSGGNLASTILELIVLWVIGIFSRRSNATTV